VSEINPASTVKDTPNNSIAAYAHGRDNNLNLLRIVAATLVLVTHAYGLTGNGGIEPLYANFGVSFGSWAVDVFFVISGFLVGKSWDRRKSVRNFLWARALRIFPALWACTIFSVFLVGFWFTTLPAWEYLFHVDTLKFIAENSTILPVGVFTTLPGVFSDHQLNSVNLSLWTLPFELKMYLMLLALGWSKYLYKRALLICLVSLSLVVFAWSVAIGQPETAIAEYCRFVFCFFSGTFLFLHRENIVLHRGAACLLIVALALCLLLPHLPWRLIALTAATPYLTIFVAFIPSRLLRAYNAVGDYSYGVYIYAGPVQQSVLAIAGGKMAYMENLAWSFCITLILAMFSWHLIENRALRLKLSTS